METATTIRGHPIHPMLIAFPVGLLGFSFICDLILFYSDNPTWGIVSYYAMAGGVVGGVIAAVPGLIDLLNLRDADVKKIAIWHMVLNLVVVLSFAFNLGLRLPDIGAPSPFHVVLSGFAIALLVISGWLGGEMVHVHRVGVMEGVSTAREAPETAAMPRAYQQRSGQDRRRMGERRSTFAH